MTNDERLQAWERLTPRQRSAVVGVVVFGNKDAWSPHWDKQYTINAVPKWLPPYAEDWHGMGLVVERMKALHEAGLHNFCLYWEDGYWLCELPYPWSGETRRLPTPDGSPADTVALAACKAFPDAFDAALREIGGER